MNYTGHKNSRFIIRLLPLTRDYFLQQNFRKFGKSPHQHSRPQQPQKSRIQLSSRHETFDDIPSEVIVCLFDDDGDDDEVISTMTDDSSFETIDDSSLVSSLGAVDGMDRLEVYLQNRYLEKEASATLSKGGSLEETGGVEVSARPSGKTHHGGGRELCET